jgi:hypothetical protein
VLAANAQPVKLSLERKHAAKFQVSLEDQFDGFGLGRVDDQTPADNVVAKWNVAAHPHALAARGRKLVPDALACDLPLELGKGQENVEG